MLYLRPPESAIMEKTPTRRFPRIPAQHVVMIHALGQRPLEEFARTRTIGLGGCMFVSEEPLVHGTPLDLAIALGGRVVRAESRVVYQKERAGKLHEVGVEFVDLSSSDRTFLEGVMAGRLES
jgi:hypothetical protein